jgi:phenylalanyl-tRNA synthetase beta chain
MGTDKISYALSFVFRDPEKTLNDRQIDQIISKLVQRLEKEVHAQIRK